MAKYTPVTVSSGYLSTAQHNQNATDIATELNNNVLYRNNPAGEPNQMQNDLDMNSNDILNANSTSTQELYIAGTKVSVTEFSGTNVVKYYGTVANMKAATDLEIGDLVSTKGYTSQGDKGHALYRIVVAATGTDDGGSYHDLTGISGQAALVHSSRIDARWFGVVGDSDGTSGNGTDDTAAIRAATVYLQSLGSGELDFGDLQMRVLTSAVDLDPLGDFQGCNGIHLMCSGAQFVVDRDFAAASAPYDYAYIFKLRTCDNTKIDRFKISCPGTRGAIYSGAIFLEVNSVGVAGCDGITMDGLDASNISICTWIHGTAGAAVTNRSKGFELGVIKAYNCGYGSNVVHSGDDLRVVLETELCGRSYFNYDARNQHDVVVISKDHQASADCLLATANGYGLDGLRLKYINTEGTAASTSNECVVLEYQDGDVYPGTHRDIHIDLNIKSTAGAYRGQGFLMRKLTAAGASDTSDRGHVLDGLTVTGSIESGGGSQESITFGGSTWGTGDSIYNVRFRDLKLEGSQPTISPTGSLKDIMILENVSYPTDMIVVGNTNYKIIMTGCTAANFTSATTEDSKVDYISCEITSGTTQALEDKNKYFVNTLVGATLHGAGTTYTPTATAVANVDTATPYASTVLSQGTAVTVSGKVDIDPTAGSTITKVGLSLPYPSAFTVQQDCAGFGGNIAGEMAVVYADATNDRAELYYTPSGTTAEAVYYQFTYTIK